MSFGKRPSPVKSIIERRRSSRRPTDLRASIVHADGRSTACWILDASASGAQLGVASVLGIPEAFDLSLPSGERYRCVVVRRAVGKLGVRFIF
jgi:hypothetical protein